MTEDDEMLMQALQMSLAAAEDPPTAEDTQQPAGQSQSNPPAQETDYTKF